MSIINWLLITETLLLFSDYLLENIVLSLEIGCFMQQMLSFSTEYLGSCCICPLIDECFFGLCERKILAFIGKITCTPSPRQLTSWSRSSGNAHLTKSFFAKKVYFPSSLLVPLPLKIY